MADTYEQLTRDLLRALDEAHLHNIQAVTRIADQINALRLSQADITAQTLRRGEANIQEQINQNVARMEHMTELARRAHDLALSDADARDPPPPNIGARDLPPNIGARDPPPPNIGAPAGNMPAAMIDDRTCALCKKRFRAPSYLREHLARKTTCAPIVGPQDYTPEELGDPNLEEKICNYCGRVFSSRASMQRHVRQNCRIKAEL